MPAIPRCSVTAQVADLLAASGPELFVSQDEAIPSGQPADTGHRGASGSRREGGAVSQVIKPVLFHKVQRILNPPLLPMEVVLCSWRTFRNVLAGGISLALWLSSG